MELGLDQELKKGVEAHKAGRTQEASGYYTAVLVMRAGEISFISPFRYSAILFALILGLIFFDEKPEKTAFFGIVIVMVAGIFLMLRNSSVQQDLNESR